MVTSLLLLTLVVALSTLSVAHAEVVVYKGKRNHRRASRAAILAQTYLMPKDGDDQPTTAVPSRSSASHSASVAHERHVAQVHAGQQGREIKVRGCPAPEPAPSRDGGAGTCDGCEEIIRLGTSSGCVVHTALAHTFSMGKSRTGCSSGHKGDMDWVHHPTKGLPDKAHPRGDICCMETLDLMAGVLAAEGAGSCPVRDELFKPVTVSAAGLASFRGSFTRTGNIVHSIELCRNEADCHYLTVLSETAVVEGGEGGGETREMLLQSLSDHTPLTGEKKVLPLRSFVYAKADPHQCDGGHNLEACQAAASAIQYPSGERLVARTTGHLAGWDTPPLLVFPPRPRDVLLMQNMLTKYGGVKWLRGHPISCRLEAFLRGTAEVQAAVMTELVGFDYSEKNFERSESRDGTRFPSLRYWCSDPDTTTSSASEGYGALKQALGFAENFCKPDHGGDGFGLKGPSRTPKKIE